MYQLIKKMALALVSKQTLIRHELFLRSIYSIRFKGKTHQCIICKHGLNRFISLPSGDLLCPFCGSRARTRRLYKLLQDESLLHGFVLHFSPSRSLYRILSKRNKMVYCSTDFENEFLADYKYDITNIDCADNTFDLIICYHILEHITEDEKAMQELARVLKPNGICLVQTPFNDGTTIFEDSNIVSKKDRLHAFGQEDHVRIYSENGLINRLKGNGFTLVEKRTFESDFSKGLLKETIIIAKKT